ncbi:NAD(P)/FAD-dependent oxidoreductase, partial [Candidatus Gracilibacteria bacterium]|nr:NAD(P)/FAD-dependent oxidoreductase [Candidatus Gracilibacteria bacterium]
MRPPVHPWPAARPRVVIIGAGFGGLSAARALGDSEVDVLVIDRNNYHGFWPLLYQVATAGLEPEAVAYPVRAILRDYRNVRFQMAEVRGVDLEQRLIFTSLADNAEPTPLTYDYLVLAAGSANNYFGNDALAEQTYGLKDVNDAQRLRNHVLSAFEYAVAENDPKVRRALMTIVIVGGGPTGVELAGAFYELILHVLKRDYPMLAVDEARVVLVEASDKLLTAFSEPSRKEALKQLQKMGVEVRLNTALKAVENNRVSLGDGSTIDAATVVWAAGVRAAAIADKLDTERVRGGRVKVQSTLNLQKYPEVFVIGDMAYLEGYQKPNQAYPMVAPVAIQMGELVSQNIVNRVKGRPLRNFTYFDKGNMATIGRRNAVLE